MIVILAAAIEGGGGAADDDISVLVCPATDEHPRSSEASVVALKDGRLLLAYSEFIGTGADDSPAQIMARTSADGGRTWGQAWVLQPNTGKQNVMSVSLLRLKSGRLMLGYLVKNSSSDLRVEVRLSSDEGKSWSEPVVLVKSQEDGWPGQISYPYAFERRPGEIWVGFRFSGPGPVCLRFNEDDLLTSRAHHPEGKRSVRASSGRLF